MSYNASISVDHRSEWHKKSMDVLGKSNMYVNNISYSDENEYTFRNGDVTIFKIKNADYILQKSNFDRK